MNGSNLIAEADLKPFNLCPLCLRKLMHYLNADLTADLKHTLETHVTFLQSLKNPFFERDI
jgi:hypothetical protein